MEAKVVLLLNATVILLISFGTDYWILLRIRQVRHGFFSSLVLGQIVAIYTPPHKNENVKKAKGRAHKLF